MAKKFDLKNIKTIDSTKEQQELQNLVFEGFGVGEVNPKGDGTFIGSNERKPASEDLRKLGVIVLPNGGVILPGVTPSEVRAAVGELRKMRENSKLEFLAKAFADAGVKNPVATYESCMGYYISGWRVDVNLGGGTSFADAVAFAVKRDAPFIKFAQNANIEGDCAGKIYPFGDVARAIWYLNGGYEMSGSDEDFEKWTELANNPEELFKKAKEEFLSKLPKQMSRMKFHFFTYQDDPLLSISRRKKLKGTPNTPVNLNIPFSIELTAKMLKKMGAMDTEQRIQPNYNAPEKSGLFGAYNPWGD